MKINKTCYVVTAVLLLLLSQRTQASAQVTRLNVGYSATSADQLPAWVAKETGIFAKNGLDIQLIFFTGGTTAILALVSGDVPITQVSGPGLVNSSFAGSDASAGTATGSSGMGHLSEYCCSASIQPWFR